MAPDPSAAAAGKSLAAAKHWPELGRSEGALWGKCQGSAVYQVKVDLVQIAFNCTCPSRKIPCKANVLAVMMLAVQSPPRAHFAISAEPPEWVVDWLEKRRAREEKLAASRDDAPPSPADSKARQRRTEERNKKVQDGLERLDLWLNDSVRAGLLDLAAKPASLWEELASAWSTPRAPGLAGSGGHAMASLPRSAPESVPCARASGRARPDQALAARVCPHRPARSAPGKRDPPDSGLERHAGSAGTRRRACSRQLGRGRPVG